MTHKYHTPMQDKQAAGSGKMANDFNKTGQQHPTQKNESKRTPHSRHDRDNQLGGGNQSLGRRGSQTHDANRQRPPKA
jgi:hypothetical protein